MKLMLKLAAIVCAGMLATGTAYAQAGPPSGGGAPAGPGYTAENYTVRNGGDEAQRDAEAARTKAIEEQRAKERPGAARTARSGPASPDDIVAGAEVRDPKGQVVGKVESVSMAAAVVVTEVGKVEVPLEAFGKNSKGLLISMSKNDFLDAVAEANKPK
ncbi:hypothetical protein OF829_07410 [Sphingomonas sp. LB-2]|uniref:hypothetical protein n=1 Tax=Sphingomonas caeni TaxID=2984949 RepID=UPI00223278ED|nr:hypothetical protein [Sphingomonas caeni]MCW3847063.1 hypothetical protein [Sphingomonas caeni]